MWWTSVVQHELSKWCGTCQPRDLPVTGLGEQRSPTDSTEGEVKPGGNLETAPSAKSSPFLALAATRYAWLVINTR